VAQTPEEPLFVASGFARTGRSWLFSSGPHWAKLRLFSDRVEIGTGFGKAALPLADIEAVHVARSLLGTSFRFEHATRTRVYLRFSTWRGDPVVAALTRHQVPLIFTR